MTTDPQGRRPWRRRSRYRARSSASVRKWKTARSCQMSTRGTAHSPVTSASIHRTLALSRPEALFRPRQRRAGDVQHADAGDGAIQEVIHETGIPASDVEHSGMRLESGRLQQFGRDCRFRLEPAHVVGGFRRVDALPVGSSIHAHLVAESDRRNQAYNRTRVPLRGPGSGTAGLSSWEAFSRALTLSRTRAARAGGEGRQRELLGQDALRPFTRLLIPAPSGEQGRRSWYWVSDSVEEAVASSNSASASSSLPTCASACARRPAARW